MTSNPSNPRGQGWLSPLVHLSNNWLSLTGVVMLIGILAYAFLIMEPVQTELAVQGTA